MKDRSLGSALVLVILGFALISRALAAVGPGFSPSPQSQVADVGTAAVFSLTATGDPVPALRWQISTNEGQTWSDLAEAAPYAGVTTATLTVTAPTLAMNGHRFRCLATNSAGTATSGIATLNVATPLLLAGDTKTGAIASGEMVLYQVAVPSGSPGMRAVLITTGSGDADLYVQRNGAPTVYSYLKRSAGSAGTDTFVLTEADATAANYTIGVYRPTGQTGVLNFTLYYERGWVQDVAWDNGNGLNTAVRSLAQQVPADHYFRVTIPANGAAYGAMAVAVNVTDGGAVLLYASPGSTAVPTPDYHTVSSTLPGANGFVLPDSAFSATQQWVFMVRYTPGPLTVLPDIRLRAGDPIVQDLGTLTATEGANSGDLVVGPEGIVFFKTAVPANTPAWALWARTNTAAGAPYANISADLGVRRLKVPIGGNADRRSASGQFLVVPAYLSANGDTYFVSLAAAPGTRLNLASYQQPIGSMAFEASSVSVALPADTFLYKTYRVDVPVQQIAWDLVATSTTGNLQLCVRRANVPNPGNNDALVEAPTGVADGLTLVPPVLSDGVWYLTVYSDGREAGGVIRTGPPVVTDIKFVDQVTNDLTEKSGWRIYRVTDIDSQLGCLGWEILLSAPVDNRLIAIRPNAVPGRRQYRSNDNTSVNNEDHFDYSSTIGDLQRPAHQGDVWYIGVYRADAALGAFTLTTRLLTAATATFDAATPPSENTVTGQAAGLWKYFRVDVPAGVLGWDLRLVDVTAGSPCLVIRRDQLPASQDTSGFYPAQSVTWPSGATWAPGADVAGYVYGSDGFDLRGTVWYDGIGNPLVPGTYYVGVTNRRGTSAAMNYTLKSRGVGPGQSIPVTALDFAGGSITRSDLAPTEVAYYKVTVPEGQTSWQIKLSALAGDVMLVVRKAGLGNCEPFLNMGSVLSQNDPIGRMTAKPGDEHYVLLPTQRAIYSGATITGYVQTLEAGDYYLSVISQGGANVGTTGDNLPGPRLGAGPASYTLLSRGTAQTQALGTVSAGGAGLEQAGEVLSNGEIKFYTFVVPEGLASVQVSLANRTGNPLLQMPGVPGAAGVDGTLIEWPGNNTYGFDGEGHGVTVQVGKEYVTLPNPAAGTYTVGVRAALYYNNGYQYPNAGYTIRVQGLGTVPLSFDGGSTTVTDQPATSWRFFRVDVPSGVHGWDLRLVNVTSGTPRIVVRRDQLPTGLTTDGSSWPGGYYNPQGASGWTTGLQWAPYEDLTGFPYSATGLDERGQVLHAGMGNPLEPGTYYIGVTNAPNTTAALSYTIQSRGIGTGQSIPVTVLDFVGGSATQTTLAPREVAYYKVTVPEGQTSWQVKLSATQGDVALAVRRGTIPNIGAAVNSGTTHNGYNQSGVVEQKTGDEHFLLQPSYAPIYSGGTVIGAVQTVEAGDYYLAVVSQGTANVGASGGGMSGPRIGTGAPGYTLLSRGPAQTQALGDVTQGGTDLVQSNETLGGGEVKFYTFNVPAGLASMQVSLENRSGTPLLQMPSAPGQLGVSAALLLWPYGCNYGLDQVGMGATVQVKDEYATLSNPAAGTYTVGVHAPMVSNNGYTYPDVGYTIRVRGLGTATVPFDGGSASAADQPAGTWRYFLIEVPAGALGWDLRLVNVTSGTPYLVVRRDQLPNTLSTTDVNWPGSSGGRSPAGATGWPSGAQWAPDDDLTGYRYSAGGKDERGRILQVGMGNPLVAGTYFVGVTSAPGTTEALSYTVQSRGIGAGLSIPVATLDFAGGTATRADLAPRELAYYKVTIPEGQETWQVKLSASTGDVLLSMHKDNLPSIAARVNAGTIKVSPDVSGLAMRKRGDEHYVLLASHDPIYSGNTITGYVTTLEPGDYYLAVVSQGATNVGALGGGLPEPRIGTGNAGYTLVSRGNAQTEALGNLTAGGADLLRSGETLSGGEVRFYTFTVPAGLASVQLSLENRIGDPLISLPSLPGCIGVNGRIDAWPYGDEYGIDGWTQGAATQMGVSFVTLANPAAGTYTVAVRAAMVYNNGYTYPDASFALRVHALAPVQLNFAASQNAGNGGTHLDTRSVGDGQIVYYRVEVPTTLDGQSILGWRVRLALATGQASWRVSKTFPPSSEDGAYIQADGTRILTLTPPYFTAGTWYLQVTGSGLATYTLTSEPIVLRRPAWTMPGVGGSVTTPGLSSTGSCFADTGLREDGTPLPDPVLGVVTDQGIDLANADYHYYAVTVPENNAGLMHAELIAINGDPNLFARADNVPSADRAQTQATLSITGTGTEYVSWVPADTRRSIRLQAGTWYLAVQAGGTTNARYRLRLSHGNPLVGGVVQDLPLSGGSFSGQLLAAGDMRFYRVEVPADALPSWRITYAQTQGDVDLFVRDGAPVGYSSPVMTGWSVDIQVIDWRRDLKNQGPYAFYPDQGSTTLTSPPLRPGHVYYLGFCANSDARFSVSSVLESSVALPSAIAFYGGRVSNVSLAAGESVRYRIEVPADAARWKHTATNGSGLRFYLEEGTPVDMTQLSSAAPHAQSNGATNWQFNQSLDNANGWPWLPGARTFYLTVNNPTEGALSFSFAMDGKNALTEDEDADGMPDAWERLNFGNIWATPGDDADGDGSTNLQEWQNGTNPKEATSVKFQLALSGVGATVAANPAPSPYAPNSTVTVTATPDAGLSFMGWGPTALIEGTSNYSPADTTNPLMVTMNANRRLVAYAGLPLATALDSGDLVWSTGGHALWVGQTATTFDGVDAAAATGLLNSAEEAWVQTTVTAPGTLTWRWKLNEVTNGGSRIRFFVNESCPYTLWGTSDWTEQSIVIGGIGTKTVRWKMERESGNSDAKGDTAWLDAVSFVPWPAPEVKQATGVTYTTFNANWSAVTGATSYVIDVATTADFSGGFIQQNRNVGNVLTFQASGLIAGTSYYYRVRALGTPGTSADSAVCSVQTTPFPAPVGLAATSIGLNEFTANWSAVEGATSYRLDVGMMADFSGALILENVSVTVTNRVVTGLQPGSSYYYRVRSVASVGVSSSSNVVTVVTALVGSPRITGQPLGHFVVSGQTATLTVVATGVELTYQWYRGTSGDTSQPVSGANGATLSVPAFQQNGSYWVRVSNSLGSFDSIEAKLIVTAPSLVLTGWGQNSTRQIDIPEGTAGLVQVAAGDIHTVALYTDGTVRAWGSNNDSRTTIPAGLSDVVAIAAGAGHSLALKSDGTVVAWGQNSSGQTTVPSGLSGVVAIAAGVSHSLALKADGTVVAWGSNYYGQIAVPAGLANVVSISAGPNQSYAIKAGGTGVIWGDTSYGLTTIPSTASSGLVALTGGGGFSLALKSDGTVVAWGYNGDERTAVPTNLSGVVSIATGTAHCLALKSDGTVVAWGSNGSGQAAVPAGLKGVVGIAAGSSNSFALFEGLSQTLKCLSGGANSYEIVVSATGAWTASEALDWVSVSPATGTGNGKVTVNVATNNSAQPRFGTIELAGRTAIVWQAGSSANNGIMAGWGQNSARQIDIPEGTAGLVQVAAGEIHTVALYTDGTVRAWGSNNDGRTTIPAGLSDVVAIAAGAGHNLALKSDGTVVAWGANSTGQTTVPSGLSGVVSIAAGVSHSLALKSDGTVVAWGSNYYGQTAVPAGLSNVVSISAGPNQSYAIKAGGTGVIWGDTSYGLTTIPSAASSGLVTLTGGGGFSLALKSDGTVVAWGYNGDERTVVPANLSGVVSIATGTAHCLALKSDGTVVAWGSNGSGQTAVPTGLKGVVGIAAGSSNSFALFEGLSQTLKCLSGGANSYEIVVSATGAWTASEALDWVSVSPATGTGNGKVTVNVATNNSAQPRFGTIQVAGRTAIVWQAGSSANNGIMTGWGQNSARQIDIPEGTAGLVQVAAGDIHTLALYADGTVRAWGSNNDGRTTIPTGLSGVVAIAAGAGHNLALKSDGTVVAWGANSSGQTTVPSGLSGVVAIAAGVSHSLALKSDGTVVAWGSNYYGQIAVPAGLSNVVSISAGPNQSYAIKAGGTGVIWGDTSYGLTTIPSTASSGLVALTGGGGFSLALKSDGTVVAWGNGADSRATVPDNLSGVVSIAAGTAHCLALKSDGTVVAWGSNGSGQAAVPTGLKGVVGIAAGSSNSFALFEGLSPTLKCLSGGASSYEIVVSATGAWTANEALDWVSVSPATGTGNGKVTVNVATNNSAQPRFGTIELAGRTVIVWQAGAYANNGTMVGWGANGSAQLTPPVGTSQLVQLASGDAHTVALKKDGTVLAWGLSYDGRTTIPTGLSGVVAIAAGAGHNLALKSDGTVVAWGANSTGQTTVPSGLSGVVAIAAGVSHSLALKSDGTVVAWGSNYYGQTAVPAGLSNVISISAGPNQSYAIKAGGTGVIWGDTSYGLTTIPSTASSGLVALTGGGGFSLALKSDGTVVAWANGADNRTTVPTNLSGVVSIATGTAHCLALKSDGTVVAWGSNGNGQATVPAGLSGVVSLAAGANFSIALKDEPLVLPSITAQPVTQTATAGGSVTFSVVAAGSPPLSYQWYHNGVAIPGATSANYSIDQTQYSQAGTYTVTVANAAGSVTSSGAVLTVQPSQRLANFSARIRVLGGAAAPLGSFTVSGVQPKPLLIRAVGPGLETLGVTGGLADPQMILLDASGQTVATNDDWGNATNAAQIAAAAVQAGAFALADGSKDSAILGVFSPGSYTVRISGVGATVGMALFEIYETDTTSRLVYFGVRGTASTGANALTGGFTVSGSGSNQYLIRAVGASTQPGMGMVLDPALALYQSTTLASSNDNWGNATTGLTLASIAQAAGLAPLLDDGKDAALLVSLSPGTYVAQATSGDGGSGLALLEITAPEGRNDASLPPAIMSPPTATTVTQEGASASFAVVATGLPLPSYQWKFNGTPIDGATAARLVLSNVQSAQFGAYTVTITNSAGSATSEAVTLALAPQYHSADYGKDWKISVSELTRMIQLYNTRFGTARTGCYLVQEGSSDGFGPDLTRDPSTSVTLTKYHSADYVQDGKIGVSELTRVIQLYNTRDGTTRTGAYHRWRDGDAVHADGFAPGP